MTTRQAERPAAAAGGGPPTPRVSAWRAGVRRVRRDGTLMALVFVVPYIILFFAFRIGPAIAGFALSFLKYRLSGKMEFLGLENYTRLFGDSLFWNALKVTAVYTVISVPLVVVVSLAMAQLSARSIRGIKVYRALYFLPVVTSLVTSGVIWQWLYSENGPLNWMFSLIGVGPVPWLSSETMVLPSLAMLSVWSRFGYDMLILLAGLLAIPKEYTEAAMIDGASAWQRFWNVTLPQLKPALFFVVVLELINSFQVFDVIYVMTGGGPVRSSYSLVFMIYDQGFHYFDFGYASAVGVVLFAITLVVTLVQRRLFRED